MSLASIIVTTDHSANEYQKSVEQSLRKKMLKIEKVVKIIIANPKI